MAMISKVTLVATVLAMLMGVLNPMAAQTSRKRVSKPDVAATSAEEREPVVIAVEGGKVYVDLLDCNVAEGDRLVVYRSDSYFVHPVTKKRIRHQVQDLAELEVERVFAEYIQAIPRPAMALSLVKPGMSVRKCEKAETDDQPAVAEPMADTGQRNHDTEMVRLMVEVENDGLPSKPVDGWYVLSVTIDGRTIYRNHVVTRKSLFRDIETEVANGRSLYDKAELDKRLSQKFYTFAREAGYAVVERWWNNDRSRYVDYTIMKGQP